jgi:hypothetical protein
MCARILEEYSHAFLNVAFFQLRLDQRDEARNVFNIDIRILLEEEVQIVVQNVNVQHNVVGICRNGFLCAVE